ncbi:hypothetical protein PMSD_18485 [Paenibacillus macquariensis subsp. defensor]|nr:hypothetical protein PMSD_18485 [Paenibacillus macquariensis subsp. defensor]
MKAVNSAARLLNIMQEIIEKAKSSKKFPYALKSCLMEIFQLDNGMESELHYKVGEIHYLISVVREDVISLALDDEEEFLKPVNTIAKIFSKYNIDSDATKLLTNDEFNTALIELKFCALAIKNERNESKIDESALDQIYNQVEEIHNFSLGVELPKELKLIIIGNLETIRKAFVDFKIHGIDGLRKAIESSLGSLIINNESIKKSDDGRNIAKKLFGIIANINQVINLGKSGKELLGPIINNFLE